MRGEKKVFAMHHDATFYKFADAILLPQQTSWCKGWFWRD